MSGFDDMKKAALNAMQHVMDLCDRDTVLVVFDEQTWRVGDAFAQAAKELGCPTETFLIPEKERPLKAVPQAMAEKLSGISVVINALHGLQEETPFRVDWIKEIMATKTIRLGHAPNITEAMMTEGPMNVDYAAMQSDAARLMKAFEGATSVHITAPGGTDLKLDIEERTFCTDTKITIEQGGNLPCGEIWCAPVETSGEGLMVCDGSIGDLENPRHPLAITIEKGKIAALTSQDEQLVQAVKEVTGVDAEADIVGELGIGLNPNAKLTGIMLEDEKALRTAHIAFGNNEDMPGGQNRSRTHRDFLFKEPTLEVTFQDGTSRVLIKDGEFLA